MPEYPVRPPGPALDGHDRWSGRRGPASGPNRPDRWADHQPPAHQGGTAWDEAEEGGWDRDFESAERHGGPAERYDEWNDRASQHRGGEDHGNFGREFSAAGNAWSGHGGQYPDERAGQWSGPPVEERDGAGVQGQRGFGAEDERAGWGGSSGFAGRPGSGPTDERSGRDGNLGFAERLGSGSPDARSGRGGENRGVAPRRGFMPEESWSGPDTANRNGHGRPGFGGADREPLAQRGFPPREESQARGTRPGLGGAREERAQRRGILDDRQRRLAGPSDDHAVALDDDDNEEPLENTAPRSLYSRLGPLTAASGVINLVRRRPSFDDLVPQESGHGPRPPRGSESFRQPRRRDRGPLAFVAAAVALLMVVGVVVFVLQRGGDEDTSSTQASLGSPTQPGEEPKTTEGAKPSEGKATKDKDKKADKGKKAAQGKAGAEKKVKRAVFRGTSPNQVAAFSRWLGRDMQYVVDYPPRATWSDIANPINTLSVWRNTDYRMVYAIGMLPGYRSDPSTLANGAKGQYNKYFETLAKNLVAYDQGDAILRLGWEANVDGYKWHPEGTRGPEDFKKFWREIVTTMRAVPGAENLAFDWNINNGGETYDSTLFYPGNKYVDFIGVDVYDISWAQDTYPYPAGCDADCRLGRQQAAWMNVMDANFGLNFWSNFARQQGRPISLPEWGVWGDRSDQQGGEDNPYFIEQMHKFIDDPKNNVAYQSYFEYDVGSKGDHRLSQHEKAGKKYVKLFGK